MIRGHGPSSVTGRGTIGCGAPVKFNMVKLLTAVVAAWALAVGAAAASQLQIQSARLEPREFNPYGPIEWRRFGSWGTGPAASHTVSEAFAPRPRGASISPTRYAA